MNIEQLKLLINKGESHNLEFKKSTTQIKGAFETLCVFLNGVGGSILIGVTNNGNDNDSNKRTFAKSTTN